ncbi:MAG: DUF4918 family protein [Chitinophagales bacterium]|nr:DUF4918 family protein [Chitinophagales bacterium]
MKVSEKILKFLAEVTFTGKLPKGIEVMTPYSDSKEVWDICQTFYNKYYDDENPRKLILGINPGRLGAGSTGIPFTDTKRLNESCHIPFTKFTTHEPSAVYMYEMMEAYGGIPVFYSQFYINSVFPLGLLKTDGPRAVNYNYYDSKVLLHALEEFIIDNIKKQRAICGGPQICYCIGSGKNFKYVSQLNERFHFFEDIIPLEHPRFIMQYKSKEKHQYIDDYLEKLSRY